MLFDPTSGNGPLLAFVFGPIGFVVGIIYGFINRDVLHRKRPGAP